MLNRYLVVIPAFNEEQNIGRVLEGLIAAKLPLDILVINDGSRDRTCQEASRYREVTVISHPCNLGYGAALQTGYKYAMKKGYPYIIQFDSDGQHSVEDLPAIMHELEHSGADIVMGSRFISREGFETGVVKGVGIGFFRMLIRRLTGKKITDPTSGLRGVSQRVFNYYSVRDRFPADFPDADILIQQILMKFTIHEVPAHMKQREAGVSMHAGLKPIFYMMQILMSIVIVLIRHKLSRKVA
ncbi:glycosyltransferase involved in cell wall biosynthesis [Paenibacillus phyllosphaerae]|uniref:Glycosyltransferase involved in cell wall biosynthesis n=1 Tax=Paenibacillus phyllosphaerae TaxID=274593 RepID=A0A7W5AUF0_9BACL|nr:glycosyltransferase family 2 protein [Paenibacillus phyllosphaerae]MBB3108744.1 glycosyltransferase involved in cell wall biosynthesis [Paenibacillus phyllosphaerae]